MPELAPPSAQRWNTDAPVVARHRDAGLVLVSKLMDGAREITELQRARPGRELALVVPGADTARGYHDLPHNRTAAVIKAYLPFSGFRCVMVINVAWYQPE